MCTDVRHRWETTLHTFIRRRFAHGKCNFSQVSNTPPPSCVVNGDDVIRNWMNWTKRDDI